MDACRLNLCDRSVAGTVDECPRSFGVCATRRGVGGVE
jgi:hypothetical protein